MAQNYIYASVLQTTVLLGQRNKKKRVICLALWTNASVPSSRFTCHHMCLCRCAEPAVCAVLRWVGLCSTPPLPYSICLKDVSTGTPKVRKREGRALAPLSPAAVSSGAGPFRLGKPLGSEGRVFDRPPLECQNAAVSAHMLSLASPSCQKEDAKKSEAHHGENSWQMISKFHDASLVEILEMERELKPSICY